MPRDVDIQPGQEFHEPAAQQANLDNLLKIFGNKDTAEALGEIAKIEKDTWKDIKTSVTSLADFVTGGGISTFKSEMIGAIEESSLGIWGPILNEFQPVIADFTEALEPIIPYIVEFVTWGVEILVPVIQWIADMVQEIIDFFTGQTIEEKFGTGSIEDFRLRYEKKLVGEGERSGGRRLPDPSNSF